MKIQLCLITFLMGAHPAFSETKTLKPAQTKVETVSEKLNNDLEDKAKQASQKMDDKTKTIMSQAIDQLKASGMLGRVPKKGDKFLPFALKNFKGETISSADLLLKNDIIVTFYRGGWCPYCSIQLHAFQEVLPEIESRGAKLIAISPEAPDETLTTQEKNGLKFTVLTDTNNDYGRSLGLVYKLPDDLQKLYKNFGIDLVKNQHNNNWELPLSATFVVGKNGAIRYAFADADYKKRAPLTEVLAALEAK